MGAHPRLVRSWRASELNAEFLRSMENYNIIATNQVCAGARCVGRDAGAAAARAGGGSRDDRGGGHGGRKRKGSGPGGPSGRVGLGGLGPRHRRGPARAAAPAPPAPRARAERLGGCGSGSTRARLGRGCCARLANGQVKGRAGAAGGARLPARRVRASGQVWGPGRRRAGGVPRPQDPRAPEHARLDALSAR